MNLEAWIGRLLGLENVQAIQSVRPSLAAPWAHRGPAWLMFGCLGLGLVALAVYLKYQPTPWTRTRLVLAALRAAVLSVLLAILADPVLTVRLEHAPRPSLAILLDNTDSMAIRDELPEPERMRLAVATGIIDDEEAASRSELPSRAQWVQDWLTRGGRVVLGRLEERFRLRPFAFDRPDGIRALDCEGPGGRIDWQRAAVQLTTDGQVTAMGKALDDLALRGAAGSMAGVVVISDFDHNSGPPPLARARALGLPVYAVGVGPTTAIDLGIDLQAPPLVKKSQRATLLVSLRQSGLDGQSVSAEITARRLDAPADTTPAALLEEPLVIARRVVELKGAVTTVDVPYTPEETGRYELAAEVAAQPGEVVVQNNHAARQLSVRDDFLRLMFVEYEPTWEWRFVKEVFHRDPLVGMRGFRTFLRSADPKVRVSNELFLPALAPKRSEFFANDVIFLGDMPAVALTDRFCDMLKEFVGRFGGGLVVIAGARFGPAQLAETPLADLLPVVPDPEARVQDQREFRLRLTAAAAQTDFMQLGDNAEENARAWDNLGALLWYQPVARLHPLGTALAEHPTETCADGKTPQPLVAMRRYGRGEVVYLALNEMWRLRRRFGEQYYRQFWGQMIHRLGLSHALGSQKRFVVRTDRQQYQPDDQVTITVELYDANFEPLLDEKLPDRRLVAELMRSPRPGQPSKPQRIGLAELREGVFEARASVLQSGAYQIRVKDPVTGEYAQTGFQVASLSAERRSAVRNAGLQQQIAEVTGGKAYDLETVVGLPDDIPQRRLVESVVRVFPLWDTWPMFAVVVLLLITEWVLRRWIHLC